MLDTDCLSVWYDILTFMYGNKTMADDQIKEALESALLRVLPTGETLPELTPDLKLVGQVPGLDSLAALEVILDLEEALSAELPDDVFVVEQDGRPRARTYEEVVFALAGVAA